MVATEAPDGIPLELKLLVSLYGRSRRISLRVERLPDRARLSRGRNNGDRSWSLMRDDLDDLRYLPPEGMKVGHTLAIRIINLDTDDGATLAILDFPVSAVTAAPKRATEAVAPGDDTSELLHLRDECTRAKEALGNRERELTQIRQALEISRSETLGQGNALAEARVAWQAELDDRLAQAHAETTKKLEVGRAAWMSELNSRIEESRARWQREAESALTRAKEAWRTEEAARLSQAEVQWREQAAQSLAEARAQVSRTESALARAEAESARMSGDGVALRRLREELAEANASLGARVRELAEARKLLETTRAELLKEKSGYAAARATWQAEMDRGLADIRAEVAANRNVPDLENRVEDRIDEAREQWRKETEESLSRAKEAWKADEAVRLARAEAQWRDRSARSLAESAERAEKAEGALARAHAHALHETNDTIELRHVREELSEMHAVLADREARLSQVRLETKRARERWKAESDVALKNAHEAWKAEEAYRISVARGDWQRDLRVVRDEEDAVNEAQSRSTRRLVLDGLLAAVLAVAVVVLYPIIAPMLSQQLPGVFPQATGEATIAAQPVHQVPLPPVAPPPPPQHVEVAIHGANVRAIPSATGAIVATLARGTKVALLQQHGNWVRVEIADGHRTQQGWVYDSYLKDASGS